jgi:hypothetical protein
MSENQNIKTMKIFEKQIWHLLILLLLIAGVITLTQFDKTFLSGSLWGIKTRIWLILAIALPITHQVYVLLCWRLELYHKSLSRNIGEKAFQIYTIGFFILFVGRMIFIILLSASNKNTFYLDPIIIYFISGIFTIIAIYAFYSVKKYFGMKRAAGLDHFDEKISKLPFVKKGIFKYTKNGMYTYAFLIIYVPALLYQSKASLLVAIFSHIYIWVHYYFTELPDIKTIYKTTVGTDK